MVYCPNCHVSMRRSHRRGILDRIQSWRGRLPYRCPICNDRFSAEPLRQKMEFALGIDVEKPRAEVVIQARNHYELDKMILALNNAMTVHRRNHTKKS